MQGAAPAEAARAVAAAVKPMEDIHADAAYRRDLVIATTQRALERARPRAGSAAASAASKIARCCLAGAASPATAPTSRRPCASPAALSHLPASASTPK